MVRLQQSVLLNENELFTEFKGALTERYVLQQIKTKHDLEVYFWSSERGNAEMDFVVDDGVDVIPIEVKAKVNLQAKSLKVYYDKFKPKRSIRTSIADYKEEDWLLNLPLYAIGNLGK